MHTWLSSGSISIEHDDEEAVPLSPDPSGTITIRQATGTSQSTPTSPEHEPLTAQYKKANKSNNSLAESYAASRDISNIEM